MTDHTANGPRASRKGPRVEYRFYFAIIFLITLPLTFVSCVLGLRRTDCHSGPDNFVARAWHQASIITPQIFSQ